MTLLREQRYRVERLVDVAASQVVQREIDGVPVLLTGTNLLPEHLCAVVVAASSVQSRQQPDGPCRPWGEIVKSLGERKCLGQRPLGDIAREQTVRAVEIRGEFAQSLRLTELLLVLARRHQRHHQTDAGDQTERIAVPQGATMLLDRLGRLPDEPQVEIAVEVADSRHHRPSRHRRVEPPRRFRPIVFIRSRENTAPRVRLGGRVVAAECLLNDRSNARCRCAAAFAPGAGVDMKQLRKPEIWQPVVGIERDRALGNCSRPFSYQSDLKFHTWCFPIRYTSYAATFGVHAHGRRPRRERVDRGARG